jgi:signal transduction histidine kinase
MTDQNWSCVLSQGTDLSTAPLKPGWIGVTAIFLALTAVAARTLALEEMRPLLTRHLGLQLVFLILYIWVLWMPRPPAWLMHLYLVVQVAIVLILISIRPQFDFVAILYVGLSYQVSLYFSGRLRWAWITGLVLLTAGSMSFYLGIIEGLALSLSNVAAEIVIPAFIIVSQEIETARNKSRELIGELENTHRQLELYASQVGEIAALQERIRLARELHDSVSQLIFSINLTTQSAQLLLTKDPGRLPEQLQRLKDMTTEALSQLRSIILQLRPPQQP